MNNETRLGLTKADKIILIIVPPLLGAVIGWFLPTLGGWASKIPFIPFGGPLEWVSKSDNQWIPFIALAVGLIAGIIFTLYAFRQSLKVTITDYELKLEKHSKVETFPKKDVTAVFTEGKNLVLLGSGGSEMFRGEIEGKKDSIGEAFLQHGYPWTIADPFENQYIRWVEEHPDFPAHVNALLAARERALKKDELSEADTLRKDLANLGIMIRDEEKSQYVRNAGADRK